MNTDEQKIIRRLVNSGLIMNKSPWCASSFLECCARDILITKGIREDATPEETKEIHGKLSNMVLDKDLSDLDIKNIQEAIKDSAL